MTKKEVVIRTVHMQNSPETPLFFQNRDLDKSYFVVTGYVADPAFVPKTKGENEWGIIWRTLNETLGQPDFCPLEESWDLFENYKAPNPNIEERYKYIQPAIDNNPDRYIVANLGITGFNMATFLRGFANFLEDLYVEPEKADALLDMVFGFEEEVIKNFCKFDIDAVSFFDDWGTQQNLIISPEMWREVFKPRYKRQFDLIHSYGKDVFFHSCGQVEAIIPDLIEIGADILNLNQPDLFGVETLGEKYGGKVCFCCPIDHQKMLKASRQDIFDYVKRLKKSLGQNGGFIGNIEDYRICGMGDETYHDIVDAFESLNAK